MIDLILKIAGILGSIGVIISAITFYQNSKLRRATWITELHHKFFENDQYKTIRIILDYEGPDYLKLQTAFDNWNDADVDLQEKFVDYINFFEYIQTLVNMGQLSNKEVNSLFGYQIRQLHNAAWIMDALRKSKSMQLQKMVKEVNQLTTN